MYHFSARDAGCFATHFFEHSSVLVLCIFPGCRVIGVVYPIAFENGPERRWPVVMHAGDSACQLTLSRAPRMAPNVIGRTSLPMKSAGLLSLGYLHELDAKVAEIVARACSHYLKPGTEN